MLDTSVAICEEGGTLAVASKPANGQRRIEDVFGRYERHAALGKMTLGIAHDFNNLLTVIMGYSDLLSTQIEEENPMRADVEEIRKAAERGAELTRQIQDFNRRQAVSPQTICLNTIVNNVDAMLRRIIGEDILLSTQLNDDLPPIRVNRAQVEQILIHLASNARDAMPDGGKLTIETSVVERQPEDVATEFGSYVQLAVSDNGVGMDENVRAHLFEPFFTTKENGKGAGLGLYTVRSMVTQAGGHIQVESEPATGTSVNILWPRFQDVGEEETRR